jgi:hypothetical protein
VNPTQPPLPGPPSTGGPSTREIPAVPQSHSAAAAVAAQPLPTGPVDYVPGPPPVVEHGAHVPPAPAGATAADADFLPRLDDEPRERDPRARARLVAGGLAVAALALLELGLLVHEGGVRLWSSVPLWSGFASLAGLLGLAVLAGGVPRRGAAGRAWPVAAAGLAGLALFWLLVVLPSADTDRGFLLTAALGCLGGAVWLSAGRGARDV